MPHPAVGHDPEATGVESGPSFGDILSQFEQAHASTPRPDASGREGTVIAVKGDSVFVDLGMKIEGILPVSEFHDPVQPGDKLRVGIMGRNEEGY